MSIVGPREFSIVFWINSLSSWSSIRNFLVFTVSRNSLSNDELFQLRFKTKFHYRGVNT